MRSEFDFIRNLKKRDGVRPRLRTGISAGIGDDCAVLRMNDLRDQVITADLLIEDIDFRREWTTAEFLGRKALAVSLSDVAAMGAAPIWSMLSIGVPDDVWNTAFLDEFYQGYFGLADAYGVELVGGDISKTPERIVIDSIVAGEVNKGAALLRSGAKPGDRIYVTNELGGAAAGLTILECGERIDASGDDRLRSLILRQLTPSPRIETGLRLTGVASSMIDISDGLSSDLSHLCDQSSAGARIFAERIPIDADLAAIFGSLENKAFESELEYALHGGEDFELLFTVDEKTAVEMESEIAGLNAELIGEMTSDVGEITLVSAEGPVRLHPRGYRHF